MFRAVLAAVLSVVGVSAPGLPWHVAGEVDSEPGSGLVIDPSVLSRQGAARVGAVTRLWEIDLFSESAQEVSAALYELRQAAREAQFDGLFTEPNLVTSSDPRERALQGAADNDLFREPVRPGVLLQAVTPDEGLSPLLVWSVLIGTAFLAAVGAVAFRRSRRREQASLIQEGNR
ncbi:MAG: hypothetical protein FWD83_06085 [Promicromonosporaceae bacterium]|nr:hypothetical protein [Promicromonosporaceae bacterium]